MQISSSAHRKTSSVNINLAVVDPHRRNISRGIKLQCRAAINAEALSERQLVHLACSWQYSK